MLVETFKGLWLKPQEVKCIYIRYTPLYGKAQGYQVEIRLTSGESFSGELVENQDDALKEATDVVKRLNDFKE